MPKQSTIEVTLQFRVYGVDSAALAETSDAEVGAYMTTMLLGILKGHRAVPLLNKPRVINVEVHRG